MGEGSEDDNTDAEVACDLRVDEVVDADEDTCKRHHQEAHLEGDPAHVEADGIDALQHLAKNAGKVVKQVVLGDVYTVVGEDALMLLGCRDQLPIDLETQVVDLALCPLIASSVPVAVQLKSVSRMKTRRHN